MCDSGTLHHSFRSALRSHCPCLWCVAAAISLFAMHLIMAQFEYRLHTRPTSSLVQSFSSRSCGAAVALNPDGCTHIQRGDDHHLIHSLHLHFYGLWFRFQSFSHIGQQVSRVIHTESGRTSRRLRRSCNDRTRTIELALHLNGCMDQLTRNLSAVVSSHCLSLSLIRDSVE